MVYDATKDRYPIAGDAGVPARKAFTIIPNDGTDLSVYPKALYIGVAGNLTVTPVGNTADTGILFGNVPIGWFPVQVRRVWDTGTDADGIVGVSD